MKSELIKSAVLGGLVIGSLVALTQNASADAANTANSSAIKVMSPTQFYDLVKQTKPNQVASNFGKPDEMITLKSAAGEAKGVVWVYHNVVVAQKSLRDARFVLINGEMKYVTLSGAA
ncbi:MAG: hypothetical protein H7Z20_04740 [Bdellovibrio sp.]|nr:hypothetical protein [Methylotenera sp.]